MSVGEKERVDPAVIEPWKRDGIVKKLCDSKAVHNANFTISGIE
jgi:hypothetical protein